MGYDAKWMAIVEQRLVELDAPRLAAMDAAGIDVAALSHTTPGIQGIADAATAVTASNTTRQTSGSSGACRITSRTTSTSRRAATFSDQALISANLTIGADRILFPVDYPREVIGRPT